MMTEPLIASFVSKEEKKEDMTPPNLEEKTFDFFMNGQFCHYDHDLQILEDQIYQISMNEVFSKANGLPHCLFTQIKKMKMDFSNKNCAVCISQFSKGDIIRKLPCRHIFHNSCVKPWFQRNIHCPVCRFDLLEYFMEKKI